MSSDLAGKHPFLDDIIERALLILNHDRFQSTILDELCSQLVKSRPSNSEELRQFVRAGCSQMKMEVSVDHIRVPNVLMQCKVAPYNETKPSEILISLGVRPKKTSLRQTLFILLQWYKEIRKIQPTDDEYQFHVVLGLIKLIHEVCHCCTSVFCAFSSLVNGETKP